MSLLVSRFWGYAVAVLLFGLTSCAPLAPGPASFKSNSYLGVGISGSADLLDRFAPHFLVASPEEPYNRIGTPVARFTSKGRVEIGVDPNRPAYFVDRLAFTTAHGNYTNLVYRVHFQEIPYSLFPFHLSAGKNTGLFVIVTLNEQELPVLYTTVHTCGCYLGFMPTNFLPRSVDPPGWNREERQYVFGVSLPSVLDFDQTNIARQQVWLVLQDGTHRVRDALVSEKRPLPEAAFIEAARQPRSTLWHLPLQEKTVSFFELDGPGKGYVKGGSKLLERVLISWWAMDWRVGVDKAYGPADETGTVFYTSLKFWDRNDSDMWPFADFLRYWGWNL